MARTGAKLASGGTRRRRGDLVRVPTITLDHDRWHEYLRTAAVARRVPGATLSVLAGGDVMSVAAGVLHVGTGVETTVDSLFQVGSITKVWTTTLLNQVDGTTPYLHAGLRATPKVV